MEIKIYKVISGEKIEIIKADYIKVLESGQTIFFIKEETVCIAPINSFIVKLTGNFIVNYF